jgi:lipid II:glycine glycyltransferase (peptidoglycan interpeptide bridge formation enzyme)
VVRVYRYKQDTCYESGDEKVNLPYELSLDMLPSFVRDMTEKISIIDPTKDSRWDEFVAGQDGGTIYHTSAWAKVIKAAYGYKPHYYVLENEAGQIIAAIPFYLVRSILTGKRLVCLPFSDFCHPLGEDASHITPLLDSAKKEINTRTASYLEIKGWQHGIPPAQLSLVARHFHTSYILDLSPDTETLLKGFHDSIRRGIRQAEKRGVTARISQSKEDLERFYELNVATRKKLGVLPQPHTFFEAIFHHVISQGSGFLVMAEWETKIIAGALFITYKDNIHYKSNASDENYLQKRPNNLVIWEAILYAHAHGYSHFDFGRCSPEEEGLRTFKARWGANEIDLPYYYYPEVGGFSTVAENSKKYRAMQLFSHVAPEFMFRAAGSLLYKHLA